MYLCIDIGGTKTIVALFDSHNRLCHSVRFATAFDQKHFFSTLIQEIRANFSTDALRAISVALPGPTENNRALWFGNLPWRNFDIAANLHHIFHVPIFVENDANLAGLAESADLPGLSVYLTFSTGIGGGIARDGQIDLSYRIYEPGHDKYKWQGEILEWEDFASAKAISDYFGHLSSEISDPADWQEVAHRIAIGLHSVISSIRPDYIVFGGPLGLKLKKYQKYLKKELSVVLSPGVHLPKLLVAKFGDESVIYGCLIYAQAQLHR